MNAECHAAKARTSAIGAAMWVLAAFWSGHAVAQDGPEAGKDADAPSAEGPAAPKAPESDPAPPEPTSADPTDAAPEAPPEDPDAGWQSVGIEADFGSAIETGFEDAVDSGTLPPELRGLIAAADAPAEPTPRRPRARFGIRPVLGMQGALPTTGTPSRGGSAGARLVHQWWTLPDTGLRPAGETRLLATGQFGGVRGYTFRLDSAAGTWLGPVGVFAGGLSRFDRRTAPGVDLPPALGVGPTARLAVRVGPVVPWFSYAPTWLVTEGRPASASTIADEDTFEAGMVLNARLMEVRLSGGRRTVATGLLWDATAGLHIRF